MIMPTIKQFQLFLVALIFGFFLGPRVIEALQRLQPNGEKFVATDERRGDISAAGTLRGSVIEDPYKKLALHAKSAYVLDVSTRRKLYSLNGEARLPLASVTKVMTALVATELLSPEEKITITPLDILEEGDTGLYAGETWTFTDLLQFTLVASSNDGASALARAVGAHLNNATSTTEAENKKIFIKKMNERALALGLSQTSFQNENGLDLEGGISGAYGSSRDMTMLFEYVFRKHPGIFASTASAGLDFQSEDDVVHHVLNTNQNVESISGIIGSKTGYTDFAGGNLVVIVDIGVDHPVIVVVLGSTREDRESDVKQLIAATIETITNPSIPPHAKY